MPLFEEVIFRQTLESVTWGKSALGRGRSAEVLRWPVGLERGGGATLHRAVGILCLFLVIGDRNNILN